MNLAQEIQNEITQKVDYLRLWLGDVERRGENAVDAGRILARAVREHYAGTIDQAELSAALEQFLRRDAGNFNL